MNKARVNFNPDERVWQKFGWSNWGKFIPQQLEMVDELEPSLLAAKSFKEGFKQAAGPIHCQRIRDGYKTNLN